MHGWVFIPRGRLTLSGKTTPEQSSPQAPAKIIIFIKISSSINLSWWICEDNFAVVAPLNGDTVILLLFEQAVAYFLFLKL